MFLPQKKAPLNFYVYPPPLCTERQKVQSNPHSIQKETETNPKGFILQHMWSYMCYCVCNGSKSQRGTRLGFNMTFQTVSSKSASSSTSHQENVTWVDLGWMTKHHHNYPRCCTRLRLLPCRRCGPHFAAGVLEQHSREERPTGCLLTLNWNKVTQHWPTTA